jgi:hypothetical protein
MSRERILEVVLTMLGAVLLLIAAAGKHPYGFYMVLRLVITVGAVYWAWRVYKVGQRAWTWMFVAVALLLNPFLPIRMQRTQWQPIDLYLGIFLIGWSGYWLFRKQTRASQRQTLISSQDGQAYQWPGTGASKEAGTSAGGTGASTGASAASQRGTSSARGWRTVSTLYSIAWTAVCLLLGGGFFLPVSSLDPSLVVIVVFVMIPAGLQAWWTDSKLYSIAWTAVCLLLGGGFSLAVSSPDSGLGLIVVSTVAFGGFLCAAMLRSRGISKALSKIRITTFARQATVTGCLIVCAIHALNFVGSLAARSSTHETQLGTSVSGTSAPLRKAAEQGDADAQYNLGVLYYEEWEGQGVPQDGTQTAFWRRTIRAWRAWINSADPYNRRYTQAVFWFRKAAEQGEADAQDALGNLYYYGHGPLNMELIMYGHYAQAALWYRKAAEQGDADAQYSLGILYDNGWGVPQDYEQAAFWYRKAAEQGNSNAQWWLGGLYYGGRGVPRDYAEAYFWYDLAAAGEQDASDSKQVAKHRDEAASHLTPANLAREQERARKWFEAHSAKPQ